MTAHVADLADAPVPKHIPLQTIGTVASTKVVRVIRALGGRSEPLVPVQTGGWSGSSLIVAVARELAVAPADRRLKVADGAVADQFLDPCVVDHARAFGCRPGWRVFPFC